MLADNYLELINSQLPRVQVSNEYKFQSKSKMSCIVLVQIEWGVSLSLFSANCEELNSTKICLVGITNQFITLKAILVWLNCVLPEAFLESVNIGIRTKKMLLQGNAFARFNPPASFSEINLAS